ncbi:MAG: SPOR domain-containing protein [Spirochaetaceae bacterium]|nr:SPOR domain-containing protein [Spirochaetaceae bacterium]
MEQKKILWILLSVTIFLFIVSITGVVWFYPGRVADSGTGKSSSDAVKAAADLDPVEWLRQGKDYPGLENPPSNNSGKEGGFSIVYGETDSGDPSVNLPVSEVVPSVIEKSEQTPVVKQEAVRVVTRTAAVAAPAPRKINVLEYWIQAGSYSSKSRAESSSKVLADKGFSNLITIKTVNTDDFFRVRMGPYSSKGEAEKFLSWVKKIDSYDKSYISEVYVQKTVN